MKTIKSILSLVAMAVLLGLASCAKSDPATEFASKLNSISEQIENADSYEVLMSLQNSADQTEAQQIMDDNKDYVLTDADKEILTEAMTRLIQTTTKKGFELSGQEISDNDLKNATNFVKPFIDKATTLGDIDRNPYNVVTEADLAPQADDDNELNVAEEENVTAAEIEN